MTLLALSLALPAAADKAPRLEKQIDAWLDARADHDRERAEELLAPGARIWYGTREGAGREIDLRSSGWEWDDELNARVTHGDLATRGSEVTGVFSESNDLYRLLGVSSWQATVTFTFDPQGRIFTELYVPLASPPNPDFESAFGAAREWVGRVHPDDLASLMPSGKMVRTRETARRWRELLVEWRAATGQKPVKLAKRREPEPPRVKPKFPPGMMDPPEMR